MQLSDVSRRVKGGIEVDLLVSPRASRTGIEGFDEWRKRLIVKVRAPPLDGRANEEVAEVMSEASGHRATVSAGHTSRQKTVFIEGDADDICANLTKT